MAELDADDSVLVDEDKDELEEVNVLVLVVVGEEYEEVGLPVGTTETVSDPKFAMYRLAFEKS